MAFEMTSPTPGSPVQHRQISANDVSLHVIDQGQGPAVLFIHGFPDTAETWRNQMSAVADAGYRAVALDLRGFGTSDAPADHRLYSAPYLVGDLVAILDALDIETAVLIGHDWGADHAQRAVIMRPDRFRALVSLSIPFAPRGEQSNWDRLRSDGLGNRYYAFGFMSAGADARFPKAEHAIPSILHWLSATPPADARWDPVDPAKHMLRPAPSDAPDWADSDYVGHTIRAFQRTGFRGGLNHYTAAQDTFDLMSAFKHVTIPQPSLYIWGAADGLCNFFHPTAPTVEELKKTQPKLVDVVRLENVGHWIQHESSDRLNEEILKFLQMLDADAGARN